MPTIASTSIDQSVLRCATVEVSVRELRNETGRVIAAVEAGERVVLTKHGRPVADIVPHHERSVARPTEVILGELAELSDMWRQLDTRGDPSDYDTGLTTDDFLR
jgi:prevent-host-death family protein